MCQKVMTKFELRFSRAYRALKKTCSFQLNVPILLFCARFFKWRCIFLLLYLFFFFFSRKPGFFVSAQPLIDFPIFTANVVKSPSVCCDVAHIFRYHRIQRLSNMFPFHADLSVISVWTNHLKCIPIKLYLIKYNYNQIFSLFTGSASYCLC